MEWENHIFSKPGEKYDVILIAEGKPLYCNKTVLSFASPVFDRMFQEEYRGRETRGREVREVELPDTQYYDAVEFLLCLFPSTVKAVTKDNLQQILPLADAYQVQSLKDRCERFVMNLFKLEIPTNTELLQYLVLAEKYGLNLLATDCVERACHRKYSGFNGLKNIREFSFISVERKYELVSRRLEMVDDDYEDDMSSSYRRHDSMNTLTESIHLERSIGGTYTPGTRSVFSGVI